VDQTYLTLTGNVALQALAIAATHEQIKTVGALIADDSENLRLVTTHSSWIGHRSGSAQCASQLANDQTLLPPLEHQLRVAQHALSVLMGRYPANWTPPDFELEDFMLPESIPLTLPAELAHRRPDIRAAEAQLHAATAAVGVAAANLYLRLRLALAPASNPRRLGNYLAPAAQQGALPETSQRHSLIMAHCARDGVRRQRRHAQP